MNEKTLLELPGATLPFYRYVIDGIDYIEFDGSACEPPEPMINAMAGFEHIAGTDKRLVMIAFHEPTPLYSRIADRYSWDVDVLKNGNVKIVFRNKG